MAKIITEKILESRYACTTVEDNISPVVDALADADPLEAEVVIRHFVFDEPHDIVAAELGLTPEQAIHLAHQGLRRLKDQLLANAQRTKT